MPEQEEQKGAGLRDRFERLYTPHRMAYISGAAKSDDCPFCEIPSMSDEEGLIVHRGQVAYAVLNLFPYNSGHLMLVPYRHISAYDELTIEEANEIAALTQHAIRAVRHASGAHGFNIGMNLGTIAGAGIAAHLHQHVVPRWSGDANFLPVIGQTKALPQLLDQTWEVVNAAWAEPADRVDVP